MGLNYHIGNRRPQSWEELAHELDRFHDALGEPSPLFKVTRNAALSTANNVVVPWDTAIDDPYSLVNLSTGIATIKIPGRWRFSWAIRANTSALAVDRFILGFLAHNGSGVALGDIAYARSTTGPISVGSAQWRMNAGDTASIFVQHNQGGVISLAVGSASVGWFDGEWISP